MACDYQVSDVAFYLNSSIQEVHLRRSHESCYEQVARLLIQVLRSIYLLDNAVLHNNDSGTKGHSLGLVMCNVDDGGAQSLMQLSDLDTHLYTQLSIQVGQRLIHQEYLRVTNDCTSHSNTLSLTTGQSLGLTIKQRSQIQDLSCFLNHLIDLILGNFSQLQTKCHVVVYGHMRIQSVVLEYHCDISILRLYIVNYSVTDLQFTGRDIFQTCDHTKSGGLTTSGRTYENDELLICDLKVEILNSFKTVRIYFADIL